MTIPTISWSNGCVKLIDQTLLPTKFKILYCRDLKTLWHAIKRLSVRGAPAIGVAAGFGVLLGAKEFKGNNTLQFRRHIKNICQYLGTSRPTAVNLFNVLHDMQQVLDEYPEDSVAALKIKLEKKAVAIYELDRRTCRQMGAFGSTLIKDGDNCLTVCNAGALATVDYGTALGVFYAAKSAKKKFKVFACETRPLLQGARLTSWELLNRGIDTTLICDNMAATLMKQKRIDAIFTGADRIALNGDAANKIGTYSLAVLAKHHNIPFYIVAPLSTFDKKTKTGGGIPIEERGRDEVVFWGNRQTAPAKVKVYNPAFDVTDNSLISAIITEVGIIKRPYTTKIKKLLR